MEIKKDKNDKYKITATIYTNEEIERIDNKLANDLDDIVNQITEAVYTNREIILLQKVIKKLKKEITQIRDKAECMDYYSLNDVIDDLSKLIGDENNEWKRKKKMDYRRLNTIKKYNVLFSDER